MALEMEQKIIPSLASLSSWVVPKDTLSKTASIATEDNLFCSSRGMPSFAKVESNSGSTSSKDFFSLNDLGAL